MVLRTTAIRCSSYKHHSAALSPSPPLYLRLSCVTDAGLYLLAKDGSSFTVIPWWLVVDVQVAPGASTGLLKNEEVRRARVNIRTGRVVLVLMGEEAGDER